VSRAARAPCRPSAAAPRPGAPASSESEQLPPDGFVDAMLEEAWLEATAAAPATQELRQDAALAEGLARRLQTTLRPYGMTVERKESVAVEKRIVCRRDIVLVRHDSLEHHPILMVEIGTSNAEWWSKMDLALSYLPVLRDGNGELAHPVLFALLTVESNTMEDAAAAAAAAAASVAASGVASVAAPAAYAAPAGAADDAAASFKAGRIATFLATSPHAKPTGGEHFRIMLLSRAETADLSALSAELGRAVCAACLVPSWVAASLRPPGDDDNRHESLGPDCLKVGNKVRNEM
jgi:hypothetical protein